MADHLAAPSPLEEHRKLSVFAGEWNGEETVFPSRWTTGGSATSKVVARMDLNGFYLIQDTRQMRDGKESFATHGVFTYDREDRTYKLFWHDSLGYYPPSPASGGWAAKSLILVRGSLRGNARHVYEVVDDNTYNMKIQFSPDAEGWNDVLTGTYRRGVSVRIVMVIRWHGKRRLAWIVFTDHLSLLDCRAWSRPMLLVNHYHWSRQAKRRRRSAVERAAMRREGAVLEDGTGCLEARRNAHAVAGRKEIWRSSQCQKNHVVDANLESQQSLRVRRPGERDRPCVRLVVRTQRQRLLSHPGHPR